MFKVIQWNCLADSLFGAHEDKGGFQSIEEGISDWSYRLPKIVGILGGKDIFLLQEVDHPIELMEHFPHMSYTWAKKPHGEDGELIAWNEMLFDRVGFHEKTELPPNQLLLSVILRHRETGKEIQVMASHLKSKGEESVRVEQVQLIIPQIKGDICLFGVDLNSEPGCTPYNLLRRHLTTFNTDQPTTHKKRKDQYIHRHIDYVFYKGLCLILFEWFPLQPGLWMPNSIIPSDHLPTIATFVI